MPTHQVRSHTLPTRIAHHSPLSLALALALALAPTPTLALSLTLSLTPTPTLALSLALSLPRIARHGSLLTRAGKIHIGQGRYKNDFGPIDPTLDSISHSRAYLHHLYRVHEPLYTMLASQHNLHYMGALAAELRERIAADDI